MADCLRGSTRLVPLVFVVVLAACGGAATPSEPGPIVVGVTLAPGTAVPSGTRPPTATPAPSATTVPTSTPRPANTLAPSVTPRPTATAMRTETPTPPPRPISFVGKGDDIVSLKKWEGAALVRITSAGTGNFAVWNYDVSGRRIDLLVNTIGAYRGTVLIDQFDNQADTTRLEVNSNGAWQIEVAPLLDATKLVVPGALVGKGDDVVLLRGAKPDLMKISHTGSSNFAVWAFSSRRVLLINDIGNYSGTKPLEISTFLLEIHADGAWNMNVTAR